MVKLWHKWRGGAVWARRVFGQKPAWMGELAPFQGWWPVMTRGQEVNGGQWRWLVVAVSWLFLQPLRGRHEPASFAGSSLFGVGGGFERCYFVFIRQARGISLSVLVYY